MNWVALDRGVRLADKRAFSADLIIARVRTATGTYDLSTDALIELKQQGISEQVLAAMLDASQKK